MPNSIEKFRRARKMSMDALGQEIGTDASTINKLEKGKINLSQDRAVQIAAVFGVTTDEIFADPNAPVEVSAHRPAPQPQGARAMIPVMGSAAGSLVSGASQMIEGPIEYMEMPRALENMRGIYALYVQGTSMEPMYRHGSKVAVSEYRPARVGDPVVVQERHEQSAPYLVSIGILEARNADKVVLQKLNPPGAVEIKATYVQSIHKVIDYEELLG